MIKDMIFRFELWLSCFPASPPRFELAIYLEVQDDNVCSPCLAPTLALVREREGTGPHPQKQNDL